MRFNKYNDLWTKTTLNTVVERITRRNTNNESNLPLTISAQYGLINQNEFFNKQIASRDLTNYILLNRGEFAYNKSYSSDYPWGAVKRLDKYDKGVLSSLYICFAPKSNVDSDFLVHYFETPKWYNEISNIAGEGARNHGLLNMAVSDYFNTKHSFPSIQEQHKISQFLNLINQRIDTQSKIIEDLDTLKNSIMDQLLMRDIFDEISIKDFINQGYARIIKASEMKKFSGEKLYLSTSSIDKNGILKIECKITYNDRPSRASMIPIKHSVWFAKMKDSIKVYKSENDDESKYILSTGFYGILCNEDVVNPDWMVEIFKSNYFNNQKDRFSEGSSMSGIKENQLEDIKVKIFKNKNLEKEYCQLFYILNKKLNVETDYLEKLKEQKKYLLSNMFI